MIYELEDRTKAAELFEGWNEKIIYSCLQNIMGKIYVDNPDDPGSACAILNCFGFYAGKPNLELLFNNEKYFIAVPRSEKWNQAIKSEFPHSLQITRFATKKNTCFDVERLKNNIKKLPNGYSISEINSELYDACMNDHMASAFVSSYENKESYQKLGMGFVILKNNRIVSGASSLSTYNGGIEIEVNTKESERRKGLAAAACSALILKCLSKNIYPSWDAHNVESLSLAEKLGYEFSHAYTAFEIKNT